MIATRSFTKQRYVWQLDAWRLLRERTCADYARQVVPSVVEGVRLLFPQTSIRLGLRIGVTTQALEGEPLINLLYEPAHRQTAVTLGLVALKAWQQAAIVGHPFPVFSLIFRLVKGPRVLLGARRDSVMLSADQRREFRRLVTSYIQARDASRVLVHGDMHASHLVANLDQDSLGFIDLEAVHIGKPATNFAQLWVGYHYADPELGLILFQEYASRFPSLMTAQFDIDVRAELAIRCHRNVRDGLRLGNQALVDKGRRVLNAVLSGTPFATTCMTGRLL